MKFEMTFSNQTIKSSREKFKNYVSLSTKKIYSLKNIPAFKTLSNKVMDSSVQYMVKVKMVKQQKK